MHSQPQVVARYDAGYTIGEITIRKHECTLCGELKTILGDDSSCDEYGHADICLDCITKIFAHYEAGTLNTCPSCNQKTEPAYCTTCAEAFSQDHAENCPENTDKKHYACNGRRV
jgi:hypothetical protein